MQPPAGICVTDTFQFNTETPYKSDDAMFLPLAKAMHGTKKTKKKAPVRVIKLNSLKKSEF